MARRNGVWLAADWGGCERGLVESGLRILDCGLGLLSQGFAGRPSRLWSRSTESGSQRRQ
jgi:hypothetical protein